MHNKRLLLMKDACSDAIIGYIDFGKSAKRSEVQLTLKSSLCK